MREGTRRYTAGEYAVLALLLERPTHGWWLATTLAPDGEVGSIWSVAKPLVYTGLKRLEADGRIKTIGLERGQRGPHRVIYQVTPQGKALVDVWLHEPVQHVRDIRSLFLLKVVLNQRLGLDPRPILDAQRALIVPLIAFMEARLDDVDPAKDPAEETSLRFRLELARTTVRFIDDCRRRYTRRHNAKARAKA
jgi:PadR family transcriptional regulator AphA